MAKKIKKNAIVKDPNVFWMIRSKDNGCYSQGECNPSFYPQRHGKIWFNHSTMMIHLKQVAVSLEAVRCFGPRANPYENAEIVQFRRVEELKLDWEGYGK